MGQRYNTVWNLFQLWRMGIVRIFLINVFMTFILWREREVEEMRDLFRRLTGWVAFYPERKKVTMYMFGYKVILFISIDEIGTHAV